MDPLPLWKLANRGRKYGGEGSCPPYFRRRFASFHAAAARSSWSTAGPCDYVFRANTPFTTLQGSTGEAQFGEICGREVPLIGHNYT